MAKAETTKKPGGRQPGAGRPEGTKSTEESTLVKRIFEARPSLTQFDLVLETGIPLTTLRGYLKREVIPKRGPVRVALEAAAKKAGVPVEEAQS